MSRFYERRDEKFFPIMNYLITAGPTREPIDPVRYLSNRSSGKMGYALAQAALDAGHAVTLISGPVCIAAPVGVRLVSVMTADEMYEAVHGHIEGVDVAVLAAAVADFKPARCEPHKIKKGEGGAEIALVQTRDILASLGALEGRRFLLAGFAAETNDLVENARRKLERKRCDVLIANDVSGAEIGFESDENAVRLFFPYRESVDLKKASKRELAGQIITILDEMKQKS